MSQATRTYTIDDLPAVLRSRVIEAKNGCWAWLGGTSSLGYGRVHVSGRLHLPHRLSAAHFGILTDESLMVCHRCDFPRCVNPAHLFQGTRSENMLDAQRKGRLCCAEIGKAAAVWNKLDGAEMCRRAARESVRTIAAGLGVNHKVISRAINEYLDAQQERNGTLGGRLSRAEVRAIIERRALPKATGASA